MHTILDPTRRGTEAILIVDVLLGDEDGSRSESQVWAMS